MKQTQTEMILDDLQAGHRITPIDALKQYGAMRLSARIWDLRDAGHVIQDRTKRVKTRRGYTHVSEFYI